MKNFFSNYFLKVLASFLLMALFLNFFACSEGDTGEPLKESEAALDATEMPKILFSQDLMKDITPNTAWEKKNLTDGFNGQRMKTGLRLFSEIANGNPKENVVISPLSIELALAMLANGADAKTLEEIENFLGEDIPIDQTNSYFVTLLSKLSDEGKCSVANSVWLRSDVPVQQEFLQTLSDYYAADSYSSAFDTNTVEDINAWAHQKTNGKISRILDSMANNAVLYLINTFDFDARWDRKYLTSEVVDGTFCSINSDAQDVRYLCSTEAAFKLDNARGFIKKYYGGDYAFVGILPDEDVDLYSFISGLDFERLLDALEQRPTGAEVSFPTFEYEFSTDVNEALKALGVTSVFEAEVADLSRLTGDKTVFFNEVVHKGYISVNETGTCAGASTLMEGVWLSEPMEIEHINFNRPFVYMIIDTQNNIPLFIGTVTSIE